MATMVYAYKAKPPIEGAEVVAEQISLSHKFYNKLIEINRAVISKAEALRRERRPDLDQAENDVEALDAAVEEKRVEIKKRNARERRKTSTSEDRAAIKQLQERLKLAKDVRREVRKSLSEDEELQKELKKILGETVQVNGKDVSIGERPEAVRKARNESGVYYGTYLLIEKAVEDAVKKTRFPKLPKFRRWGESNLCGAQIQRGIDEQTMTLGQDTRLAMRGLRPERRVPLVLFSIRVNSTDKGNPIWCRIPVYLHRALPADAKIMWATIVRKQVAVRRNSEGKYVPYYEWAVQLTLRTNEVKEHAHSGACGVDIGWRLMDGKTLRVAYWSGNDGARRELRLPKKLMVRWAKTDDLQSIRDKNFSEAVAILRQWLAEHAPPEWLKLACRFIHAWKGKGHLVQVIRQWRENKPADRSEKLMLMLLEAWHDHDAHLWQWQLANEKKARAWRLDIYRKFANMIRNRYSRVYVEDFNLAKLRKRKPAEANADDEAMRRNMNSGAVGLLRSLLVQDGARKVPTEYSTMECWKCGTIQDWDRMILEHTCINPECNNTEDQDKNASLVLLARGEAMPEENGGENGPSPNGDHDLGNGATIDASRGEETHAGNEVMPPPPAKGGRWAKRKSARSQKAEEDSTE